jgi:hypothetical protein
VTMRLFKELEAEWSELAVSAPAVAAVETWAGSDFSLLGLKNLRDVVHIVQRSGRPSGGDQVLACLATRAPSDPLAARALLQVVLYGLIRIAVAFRCTRYSDEDLASIVVAAAYERIRTYPIERRPRSIAANILLDTRQKVSRSLFRPRVSEVLTPDVGRHVADSSGAPAADELLALIDEAVRTRKLRIEDAGLIVMSRVAGVPTAELAAGYGCAPQSLRRRRQRAEAALAAAVRCVA